MDQTVDLDCEKSKEIWDGVPDVEVNGLAESTFSPCELFFVYE